MGSLLSPVITDIIMRDIEEKTLNNIKFNLPFYIRYVDDIILAVPKNSLGELFQFYT